MKQFTREVKGNEDQWAAFVIFEVARQLKGTITFQESGVYLTLLGVTYHGTSAAELRNILMDLIGL